MRKNIAMSFLWAVVFAFCFYTFPSEAVTPLPTTILEISGIFEGIDEGTVPSTIVLSVDGQQASGILSGASIFLNEQKKVVDRGLFLKNYLKHVVTLEIREDTGEVVLCRVGS